MTLLHHPRTLKSVNRQTKECTTCQNTAHRHDRHATSGQLLDRI